MSLPHPRGVPNLSREGCPLQDLRPICSDPEVHPCGEAFFFESKPSNLEATATITSLGSWTRYLAASASDGTAPESHNWG